MRAALDGKQDFGNTPEGVVCRSRIRCSFRCISADFAEPSVPLTRGMGGRGCISISTTALKLHAELLGRADAVRPPASSLVSAFG
jgi:hypothetical protein